MDIPKKKQEVLEDIARQPANLVFARISIIDTIQLADLLKETVYSKVYMKKIHLIQTDSLHGEIKSCKNKD